MPALLVFLLRSPKAVKQKHGGKQGASVAKKSKRRARQAMKQEKSKDVF
jgi:hypothetical protein